MIAPILGDHGSEEDSDLYDKVETEVIEVNTLDEQNSYLTLTPLKKF